MARNRPENIGIVIRAREACKAGMVCECKAMAARIIASQAVNEMRQGRFRPEARRSCPYAHLALVSAMSARIARKKALAVLKMSYQERKKRGADDGRRWLALLR